VLSGLAVCAALTAAVAGLTGAWSPCGFSMVETIGSALGDARRGATLLASATFALGTLIGGVVTFGGLALVGGLVGGQATWLREALGAALALAAAIADWRGVRIAPQIRRQVPERWRWTMPLPLACALYGVLLGLGFTTFVLAFAVWALAGISFAAGDPALGALVGLAFAAGRAAPVLWLAPGLRRGDGGRRLDEMASEPRLWLGLRRLDALGLVLCALALGGASASASAQAAGIAAATDPSAAGGELVWQQLAGAGALSNAAGAVSALPGAHPALGGGLIAWASASGVTVADAATLTPHLMLPAAGVSALAVSSGWVVYRAPLGTGAGAGTGAGVGPGAERLIAVALADPSQPRVLAGPRPAGQIGRPSLDGARVVFALNTPRRSTIELVDLESGARRPLRVANRDAQYANPSLLAGRLLFELTTRCAQQLQLGVAIATRGAARTGAGERTLLLMRSTVKRDIGYEPGFEHAYNSGSLCGDQGAGGGGRTRLGPTALSATRAYVTEIAGAGARIVSLRLSARRPVRPATA
jgi:hypothetical protein